MFPVRIKAYAKLNLTLDLVGEEGGYHMLDSLVCSVDLFDVIWASKRRDGQINLTMHGLGCETLPLEENNAYKAARAFVQTFSTNGADIRIYKNIPLGAGMGGSSADAAGVLNAMAKLYAIKDTVALKAIADSLGSDTGYMLTGGFARLNGRGEKVRPIGACLQLNFLVLVPDGGVSTAKCFALCKGETEERERRTHAACEALQAGNLADLGASFQNALYPAAVQLNPRVAQAAEELKSLSPLGVCMTGSGSGVFALFETEELCKWAQSKYQGKAAAFCVKTVEPTKKSKIWGNPFALSEEERAH